MFALMDAHFDAVIAGATLETEPGPHVVIRDLLPSDLYAHLVDTIPPQEDFDVADDTKANFDPATSTAAPPVSRDTWQAFERDVVDALLTPRLVKRFRPYLDAMYRDLFGPLADRALALRQHAFRSRLMLRRPGYRLKPHRDSKIVAITGLIYFARQGDSPEYGTDLYRVIGDLQAPSMKTFYPESCGARAEPVKSVPFIGNSALVFLNVPGMAHAAAIPRKTQQRERYAYQFYIGPPEPDLAQLVLQMPPAQQAQWTGINLPALRS
jgi:hypothetical protein